ncbi:MAG TPA: KGK domain-containing protein [Chroococcales cyanobacterium]|jgi:hypothetical protein
MDESLNPVNCNDDDVFTLGDDAFKVSKFRKAVTKAFGNDVGYQLSNQLKAHLGVKIADAILAPQGMNYPYARWFNDGIDCEILKIGSKNWQKGKVRIKVSVEFCVEAPEDSETPEIEEPTIREPESPLDDLRQMMKEEK